MDAEGRIIPVVEDDMGEGFKDPIEDLEALVEDYKMLKAEGEAEEKKIERHIVDADKPFTLKPQVILVKMDGVKEGDKIGLYNIPENGQIGLGNQTFKIQRIRSNGSIVLKLSKK